MKKLLFVVPALAAAALVFAQTPEVKAPAAGDARAAKIEQRKADMDAKFAVRREQMKQAKAETDAIVEKYNSAATDKEKAAARKELRARIAARAEKGLKMKEERLEKLKKDVKEAEKSLKEQKKNKDKFIDSTTDAILSGDKDFFKKQFEGFDKKDFKAKKGFKKGRNK